MQVERADLDTSVPDWLIEYPELMRLFETLGIDYSCGGKSLKAAAQDAGLDPTNLLKQLQHAIVIAKG
jgi:regulator of cell morphogenesis and NO signaling